MNNKETLKSYNNRLNTNNITLDNIIETIDTLPEAKEVVLQDKTIEITENGTQTIKADSGYDGLNEVEVITNVASSGGSGGGSQPFPITDTITVSGELGTYTSYSTTLGTYTEERGMPDMVLVIWFARSECNISNNVTQIYQSDWFTSPSATKQRLYIGYMKYSAGETITVTQTDNARLGIGYIPLCNCGVPIIMDSQYVSASSTGSVDMNFDEYLNIYVASNIYSFRFAPSKLPTGSRAYTGTTRLAYVMSNGVDAEGKVGWQGQFYGNIVQVRCPYKKAS